MGSQMVSQLPALAQVREQSPACGFALRQSWLIPKLGQHLQIQSALIPHRHPPHREDSPVGAWRDFHSPDTHQDPQEGTERSPGVPLQPFEGLGVQQLCPRGLKQTHMH